MKIVVKEVATKRELRQFVTFPNKLYKNNPYYVPQLVQAEIDTLTPEKNHAFDVCEGKYWLAYSDGKIAGRIAGIINHDYNQRNGAVYVRFGWLDFVDNKEVAEALVATVEAWAKTKNARYVCGPVGFLEFDVSGVLVEGFDQLPTAYGKYNAPYYATYIEGLGYKKEVDWVEYQIKIPDKFPENVIEMSEKIAVRYNVKLLQFDNKKELVNKYCDKIFKLMNRQYERVHGYTQLSQGQIDDLKKQFIPLLNLKFVTIVIDKDDEVIGFAICLPSLSKALQKANGSMYPFGFMHILGALRKNDTIDSLLVAVATEYQNKGITAMMFSRLWQQMHDNGFTTIESTRQWEDNLQVRNLWNRFEYKLHKRARSYIKEL
ncbi:MAG: GNAT family N-acetyltransferase [Bacteroidales bacterium]|nr:GNAT family N-acetyltransferase [Bacteroidales bacterium]